jgi:hypothetical protein
MSKIKFFSSLIIMLISITLLSPIAISVLKSESAVLDVTLSLPIDFKVAPDGRLSYLNVDFVMIPVHDSRQQIFSQGFNINPVSLKDNVASFRITEPNNIVIRADYGIKTTVDFSTITRKVDFPIQNLDPSLYKYVLETEVYDINQEIKNLAVILSEGKDDLFKVVFKIANWVNNNIEYDLSTVSPEQLPATWVIANKRGVCTEYSSLLISLLRSLGIPAREVSGFAYTESELFSRGWEFHSWVEVFFPEFGWVPFDPTYGQYGFVDAGHVQLGLTHEGAPRMNSFAWRSLGVDVVPGQTGLNVEVVRLEGAWDFSQLDISSKILSSEVGHGSYNLLQINLENKNPFYIAETIRVSGVQGLTFLSPRNKAVVLAPYESKTIYFVLKVNDNLERGFFYTFPIRFHINNEVFSNTFRALKGASIISENDVSTFLEEKTHSSKPLHCNITPLARLGEKITLSCNTVQEEGKLCFNDFCKQFAKDEELILDISATEAGLFTKHVYLDTNNEIRNTFVNYMVLDEAAIDLSGTNYLEKLTPADIGFINVSLKRTSSAIPRNVSLKLKHSYFEDNYFISEINDKFFFNYAFPSRNLKRGMNTIIIEVTYIDDLGKEYLATKQVNILLEGLSFFDEIEFFLKRIYFWFRNLW